MNIEVTNLPIPTLTCVTYQACCCRLEVMILSDTGVPASYIKTVQWGGEVMQRLDDDWCAALDRDTQRCTIYAARPWVCREFEMGSPECIGERKSGS